MKVYFNEVLGWKSRVISHYMIHKNLIGEMCQWKWDTYNDMIKSMSFMKHYLPKDMEWNAATYEILLTIPSQENRSII